MATRVFSKGGSVIHSAVGTMKEVVEDAVRKGVDLSRASLHNTDLRWANLEGAKLCGADLRGAYLNKANLKGVDLSPKSEERTDISGVDFRSAKVTKANLRGVFGRDTDFGYADLSGSDLTLATFHDAEFRDALLHRVVLSGAMLAGCDLIPVGQRSDGLNMHLQSNGRTYRILLGGCYLALGRLLSKFFDADKLEGINKETLEMVAYAEKMAEIRGLFKRGKKGYYHGDD